MKSLDEIIMDAEGLLPLDQFSDKCDTLRFSPLFHKDRKLTKSLVDRIFKANLSSTYLNNSRIKNLHLGLISIQRWEYDKAFNYFKKVHETDKDSLYTYAFFTFLANRLMDVYKHAEGLKKYNDNHPSWSPPKHVIKSNKLHQKFDSLFPFLKRKNENIKQLSGNYKLLSNYYKRASNKLMKEVVKKILKKRYKDFRKIFESTNDVYEFSDNLLSHLFIIKRYGKKEGFILEKKLVDYYKRDKDLKLPKIIYKSDKKKIIVFLREHKMNFLTLFENINEIKKYIKDKGEPINHESILRKLTKKNLVSSIFYHAVFGRTEFSKTDLQTHSYNWVQQRFESLIRVLARIHTNTPHSLLREKTEIDYKGDIDSFCEEVSKLTNSKFKDTQQFKEDYDLIINYLSAAQKVIYKDAYLKNNLWISEYGSFWGNLNEIQIIDFEKGCLAPAQLDLAQILDFGNFLNDGEKEKLLDSYIWHINPLEGHKDYPKIIKNKEEFKKIFDYACVHRNLLHFRSQSKLLSQGDEGTHTKKYQKISLEKSIKALDKILSYEDKQYEPQLKRIKSYLESVYRELYP